MATELPQLKGIAVGNGCWGGDATHVQCNGKSTFAVTYIAFVPVQLAFRKWMRKFIISP
jgi:hypothetical protein